MEMLNNLLYSVIGSIIYARIYNQLNISHVSSMVNNT